MSPTIRIDDDVYEWLKGEAEPFVDTPNSVLRRLLGLGSDRVQEADADSVDVAELATSSNGSRRDAKSEPNTRPLGAVPPTVRRPGKKGKTASKRTRVPAGSLLPEEEYDLPLLEALIEAGGDAPSRDVVARVGDKLADKLTDLDKERLTSGGIRWQSRVQFVRLRLIERALLSRTAARGIWAITDQGRRYVETQGHGTR